MRIEDIWYRDSVGAMMARAVLTPLSWMYGSAAGARNRMYDIGMLRRTKSAVPVVSVGNVTVGGTGKTPFTAYLVRELLAAGHRPAVVMRGYGDDEPTLHRRMNPGAPVFTAARRSDGISRAAAAGSDVVVLDDAFQHRAAQRDMDIVLVSAERWSLRARLLPAGPLRESVGSLRRADIVVVTRKTASAERVSVVVGAIRKLVNGETHVMVASLEPLQIVSASSGEAVELSMIRGARVLAIAGVGDPAGFFAQLEQLGAAVTECRFPDHHAYSAVESSDLVRRFQGHKYAVTTEKDAVKLTGVWPVSGPELWYLSQAVYVTEGKPVLDAALADLFKRVTSIVG